MDSNTKQSVLDVLAQHNDDSTYRRFALQFSEFGGLVALISNEKENGGVDVCVCKDDFLLQMALERTFQDTETKTIVGIQESFYRLRIQRWHVNLW